jgi:hypothetical protein
MLFETTMWCHFEAWTFSTSNIIGTPYDKTLLIFWICEDLQKHPLVIDIGGSLKNQNQVQNISNDYDKFEFWDCLSYCDGFLHIFDGLTWLQVL